MNAKLLKRGPTIAVTVFGLICTVPYLSGGGSENAAASADSDPKEKEKEKGKDPGKEKAASKIPKLTLKQLLKPKLAGRPNRDPFKDRATVTREATERLSKLFQTFIATKILKTPSGKLPMVSRTVRPKPKGTAAAKTNATFDPRNALALNATYILGERGAALINGQIYRAGDTIRGLSVADPCVIGEVGRDEVLIRFRGQTYALVYKSGGNFVAVSSKRAKPSGAKSPKGPKKRR